ncbi:MAG: IS1634 family transposase [Clostridia bacterium]|nr:IS1634 family transposase [Clostridia bacterium]
MIRKDKKILPGGQIKTYIRVMEGYRPAPGKPPKQRTLKSFGYLEDQPDPEAFMREVEAFDADPANREQISSNKMYSGQNRRLNYGYKYLETVYNTLGISDFIRSYEKRSNFRGTYSLDEIFRLLVLLRILEPDSKRASAQRQNAFYGWDPQIELPNVYRALDHFAAFSVPLQQHLDGQVKALIGRDLKYAFYDVTNYFFEIDFPDEDGELRKRGVSKEHRVDPIVQMGLFIDPNGLPVSMSLFPGNTSDTLTLQPVMVDVKKAYQMQRLIVVADKGLNSSKNIDFICQNGDGYVVSQILKGKKGKRYQEALFDENGYVWNKDKTYKYKLYTEDYEGKDQDGKTETRQRQVLIYWNKAEADMSKKKREEKLIKAALACKNGAYGIKKGSQEYVLEEIADEKTGELEAVSKKAIRSVNLEKAENDALFDGYFCLITSEMDYDAPKIREVYSGLWKIEESFRIMKSDLLARPVYVSTQEHIRAHFLICFVALLMVRLIQHAMGPKALSVTRLATALNAATCKVRRGGLVELDDVGGSLAFVKRKNQQGETIDTLVFSDEDEIAKDYLQIQKAFGTNFYEVEVKQESFGRFLKKITFKP